MKMKVLVIYNSLQPYELPPTGLLCPWNSQGKILSGLLFHPPGDLPNPGTEPRSLTLQADCLLSHQ